MAETFAELFDEMLAFENDIKETSSDQPDIVAAADRMIATITLYQQLVLNGAMVNDEFIISFGKDLYNASVGDGMSGDPDYVTDIVEQLETIRENLNDN